LSIKPDGLSTAISITSPPHRSPFHRMVKIGIDPEDLAGEVSKDSGDFGERVQRRAAR
jgi:hypothetical protein